MTYNYKLCEMCGYYIIKNQWQCNDFCKWCNKKIRQMAGNYQLNNGRPYTRDDNGRPI